MLYGFHIQEIMKLINQRGAISESKIEEALKEWGEDKAISIWTVNDIIDRAKQRNKRISKHKAMEILEELEHDFNASIGINWDVIDRYIFGFNKK